MNYALIKTGIVANIIVADAAFAESIAHDWEAVVLQSLFVSEDRNNPQGPVVI